MWIDLNCDLGEGAGPDEGGQDRFLLPLVTSASIACGFHAGDPTRMAQTVEAALAHGVGLGAHPGLPDRAGFGRRTMAMEADDIYNLVLYQIGALAAFARRHGQPLQHVKPHGALYHMAEAQPALAAAVAGAVRDGGHRLILVGLAGGALLEAGRRAGLEVAGEVFADRTYRPDGGLTPRDQPGAVITDPAAAAERMVRWVTGGVLPASDGTPLRLEARTICVHGDTPDALQLAHALRGALDACGVAVRRLGDP